MGFRSFAEPQAVLPDASKFRRLGAQALIQFPMLTRSHHSTFDMKANFPVTFKILDLIQKLTDEFSENFSADRIGGKSVDGSW